MVVGFSGLTGMIGKNIVERWRSDVRLRQRCTLVGFTRRASNTAFLEEHGVESRRVDYYEPASFRGTLDDVDAFVHLAGITKAVHRREYHRVNVLGTRGVLEALRRFGGRIRHVLLGSSVAASGPAQEPGLFRTEDDPPRPVSLYGASKLQAEGLLRASGLPWTVLRLSAVYGPYDTDGLALLRMAASGVAFTVGPGEDTFSYIFAQDLAPLMLRLPLEERVLNRVVNICYDEPVAAELYCREARRHLGLAPQLRVVRVPRPLGHAVGVALQLGQLLTGRASIVSHDKIRELIGKHWRFSNRRLKESLGLQSLRENGAMAETVQWFRRRGLL